MTQFIHLEDSVVKGHRAGSPPKEIMWSHDKELRMRETLRFLLLNNDQVHWCSQVDGGEYALIVKAATALPLFLFPLLQHQHYLVNLETGWHRA